MKRFEKIFGVAFVVALIFQFYLIPGRGLLITLVLTILACFYYFFGFAFFNNIKLKNIFSSKSYEGISALRIIGSIATGWILSIVCIGILFKIMHWTGRITLLLAGSIMIFLLTSSVLYRFFQTKSNFYKTIFLRITIIGGLGILLFFTSDLTLTKIKYRNYPDYVKAYERYLDNPQSIDAKRQYDIEFNRVVLHKEESEN